MSILAPSTGPSWNETEAHLAADEDELEGSNFLADALVADAGCPFHRLEGFRGKALVCSLSGAEGKTGRAQAWSHQCKALFVLLR